MVFVDRCLLCLFSLVQYHDGLGFLTNHAMISNTFEYSLQVCTYAVVRKG